MIGPNKSTLAGEQERDGRENDVLSGIRQRLSLRWLHFGGAGVAMLALASCAAQYQNHGYIPSEEDLAEIIVGVDTRDTVSDVIGSPSSAGLLSTSGYYYVRSRVRSFGAQRPKVVERQVLAITFDAEGVVSNIERYGLEDGQIVTLERRVTESSVVDRTFLRQLLGSLGRIGGNFGS